MCIRDRVWYDEFTLKVGDSLRKSIDNGLINSKYGTVIISSAFCSKNWTQYEFDSMVSREMNGHKMILPIWHKVTKNDVLNFSPALADKVALNTSLNSIEEMCIRDRGDVNKPDLELLRKADVIMLDVLHATGLYDKTWQAFTVLLNVKSVGVMGDNRTYDNTVCVRIVEATDGMTATFAHIPHDVLETISRRIINEVDGINRVVYDISSKPPATIEWE